MNSALFLTNNRMNFTLFLTNGGANVAAPQSGHEK